MNAAWDFVESFHPKSLKQYFTLNSVYFYQVPSISFEVSLLYCFFFQANCFCLDFITVHNAWVNDAFVKLQGSSIISIPTLFRPSISQLKYCINNSPTKLSGNTKLWYHVYYSIFCWYF